MSNTYTIDQIKNSIYGKVGTEERDSLVTIGLKLRQARETKNLTQSQIANSVNKKREYISRIENNGSNITLKTLYDIVEKGLGGKVNISIEV